MTLKTKLASTVLCLSLCASALAQQLVLTGKVFETSGPMGDAPVPGATVEFFDGNDKKIGETLSDLKGVFRFQVARAAIGKNAVMKVGLAGYSENPTTKPVKVGLFATNNEFQQPTVLLTNIDGIRNSPSYVERIAKATAQAQASPDQKELANAIYVSLAGLPKESQEVAFNGVRAQSPTAYSELLQVKQEVVKARELETFAREGLSPAFEVSPRFTLGGKVRLSGTVSTKQEMDAILKQANDKGFALPKIQNNIRIQRP